MEGFGQAPKGTRVSRDQALAKGYFLGQEFLTAFPWEQTPPGLSVLLSKLVLLQCFTTPMFNSAPWAGPGFLWDSNFQLRLSCKSDTLTLGCPCALTMN